METEVKKLQALLGDAIIAEEDISPEKILGARLFEKGLTLGTAESCTGGNIAHMITSVPGSSNYFKGSVVSYTNEEKVNVLHVSQENIDKYTAVSEIVAAQMAKGAQNLLNVDCVIATTGIAGPDGSTEENPVGTVWVCTVYKNKSITKRYQFGKYRESNIMRASNNGMLQLLEMIDNNIY